MTPDSPDFEGLRRLLAIKRYEQPPPGYFNAFSRQVIVRIRAGERSEEATWFQSFFADASWMHRLWAALETRPALVGAVGALVCGLLISGAIYSPAANSLADNSFTDIFQPLARPTMGSILADPVRASTEPMLGSQQRAPLFDGQFQPASFSVWK
jgi:hypothetical protein